MKHLKYDLPSGIVVYLVALPLCLGIALASGAPIMSGIISGIIGGIVVGSISGSSTSVSGPAAGLATVVLASITQLGSFEIFSTALLIAGVLQLGIGCFKGGAIANYIPSNVIKGLLVAIGILLILKQIPKAMGYDLAHEDVFAFSQPNGENTFTHLFGSFTHFNVGSIAISIISLALLIVWSKLPFRVMKILPSSLIVVVIGICLSELFKQSPLFIVEKEHLVSIPPDSISSLFSLRIPDIANLYNSKVWMVAITIAAVASLETLLNLEAVDNIDPHKRKSPPNRELIAQGTGNVLAGLIGGLPITSVIVRSSVNIESGSRSKASTITHGIILLVSILLLAPIINKIPLASLAAILIITGYKLAKAKIFKDVYAKGWNQFIPFAATILGIIFIDLLIGVVIGLAVSIFYLLKSNLKNPFKLQKDKVYSSETIRIELPNQVSFLNKATIKETLWSIPENSQVIIDATNTDYIDNDVLEILKDFKEVVAPEKKIKLNKIGLKKEYQLTDHIQFVNVLDKNTREHLTPEAILNLLKAGNERFLKGKWSKKEFMHQVNATATGQFPMAVVLSCIDSRTSPEVVFDANLGDLISIRIGGNIVSPEIIGSMELSHKEIGIKLIVVMGHSNCGAVNAAIHKINAGKIAMITDKIQPSVAIVAETLGKTDTLPHGDLLDKSSRLNTQNSVNEILSSSNYIREQVAGGKLGIVAAYYDTNTGNISFEALVTLN